VIRGEQLHVTSNFLTISGFGKIIVVEPVSNSKIRDWGIVNYVRLVALLLKSPFCGFSLAQAQRDQLEHIVEECPRRRVINAARPQLRWRISNVAPKRLNFSTTSPMRTSAARAGAGSSMAHCAFIWGIMAAGRLIGACCSAPPTNSSCPPAILISRYPHCFLAAIVNRAAAVEKRLMSE
jgi:hypothetical protein